MITKKHRDELKSFDAPHQPYSPAVRVDLLLQELVDSNGGSECVPVLVRGKLQRYHKITIVSIVTTIVTTIVTIIVTVIAVVLLIAIITVIVIVIVIVVIIVIVILLVILKY